MFGDEGNYFCNVTSGRELIQSMFVVVTRKYTRYNVNFSAPKVTCLVPIQIMLRETKFKMATLYDVYFYYLFC